MITPQNSRYQKQMLFSGIGPADHLRAHGVEVRLDHAEVGQNLHDHPLVGGVAFEARRTVPPSAYNHGEGMLVQTDARRVILSPKGFHDLPSRPQWHEECAAHAAAAEGGKGIGLFL